MTDPADPTETREADDQPEGDTAEASAETEVETSPLQALATERDRLKDQLLRTAADFDNFRKRARRDVEEAIRRGKEEVLREVIPIIDNLERAVSAADSADNVQAVIDGVKMVVKLFEDTSGRLGIERLSAVGERFDPSIHDAVQQIETEEHPAGTIIAEVVPGYRLGERLLRAAMVVVARPPNKPTHERSSNGAD